MQQPASAKLVLEIRHAARIGKVSEIPTTDLSQLYGYRRLSPLQQCLESRLLLSSLVCGWLGITEKNKVMHLPSSRQLPPPRPRAITNLPSPALQEKVILGLEIDRQRPHAAKPTPPHRAGTRSWTLSGQPIPSQFGSGEIWRSRMQLASRSSVLRRTGR